MEHAQEIKEILTPGKTVVLVWDAQNMLVNGIFNKEEFLLSTQNVISSARKNNIQLIFAKITPLSGKFESPVRRFNQKIRPMKLNFTPDGLDLAIKPQENDIVIPKNTASIFIGTNFELLLRNAGITTIVFMGIATEMGIESSARDASNRGFFPVIVTDAVSSFNQEAHNRSLENLKSMMILLNSKEIVSLW